MRAFRAIRSGLVLVIAGTLLIGLPITGVQADPLPAFHSQVELQGVGMTLITSSHPSVAKAAVRDYFLHYGVHNTRPIKCFNVFWANSNHTWVYQTISAYADRHTSICRPSDGHQIIQHRVNGRWREIENVGTGVSTGYCQSMVRDLHRAGASTRVVRDIRTRADFGPC